MKRASKKSESAFPSGISVIEVLISMAILAVGLLGVAAMFPVGSHYMERGDEYDRADAVAEAALNQAVTAGLLDPENWLMFSSRGIASEGYYVASVPEYLRIGQEALAQQVAALGPPQPAQREQRLAQIDNIEWQRGQANAAEFGSVFVVDPLGVASSIVPAQSTATNKYMTNDNLSFFPASATRTGLTAGPAGTNRTQANWSPWQNRWPVRRLTVQGPGIPGTTVQALVADSSLGFTPAPISGHPLSLPAAEQIVRANDDLSVEFGDDADKPSQLLADQISLSAGNPATNVGNLVKGDYSWLLTVAPTTAEARDALAYPGSGGSYDVSAVVMRGRPLAETYIRNHPADEVGGTQQLMLGERLAGARILSKGTSGGEIELYQQITGSGGQQPYEALDSSNDLPWEELRSGSWVMLIGPHPQSMTKKPLLFAQWYRVVANDDSSVTGEDVNGRVLGPRIALRGPDWPWEGTETITQDLRAIIVPAAVAVHTRTMQLSAGASWAPQ